MTAIEPLTTPHIAKLTVEDFLLLDRSGAFDAYAKSELINGTIYVVNAQHRPHARIKSRLARALEDALADHSALEVLTEAGIETGSGSLPEPDIVITDEPDGEGFVPLRSVHMVAEVADTSLGFDLGEKAALYASLAIPECWVIDVRGRRVHQLWSPRDEGYAERREIPFGDIVEAVTIAGVSARTDGL